MKPLSELDKVRVTGLRGLLFDLDDTLLDDGRLSETAYSSLFRLRERGLELYAVTGRPAGWGELLVRQWPIDAAVTENGAISVRRSGKHVETIDWTPAAERTLRQKKLHALSAELRRKMPELRPTDDVRWRITDYTFDIAETCSLPREKLDQVVRLARHLGARTTVSSVHLHLSLDGTDKASGSVALISKLHRLDPTQVLQRYAFVGDSENDQACFAAFELTFGVANLSGRPTLPPRYLTRNARGDGFAELSRMLVSLRCGTEGAHFGGSD